MARNVNPSIIIGLGGSGQKTIFEVKKSLLREYGEVPKCIKLLCFDTNLKEMKQRKAETIYSKRVRGKEERELEAPHLVEFAKDEAYGIPLRNPQGLVNANFIEPWLTEWAKSEIKPSTTGASCIRQKGRFAFFENYQNIGAEGSGIETIIAKASKEVHDINLHIDPYYEILTGNEIGEDEKPIVHLVFSPSGGTGGGTFLDFIMLIKSMPENFKLCTYMIMPSFYEHYQGTENVNANSYAAFKEIDHLMGQDAAMKQQKWSNYSHRNPWNFSWTGGGAPLAMHKYQPLFDMGMIFDNKLDTNSMLSSPDEVYRRIADILYTVSSGAGSAIESILSNAESHSALPSSPETGGKRRNYFASGIASASIDRYELISFRKKTCLQYAFQQYLSVEFDGDAASKRSQEFIKFHDLAERAIDNQIIDALYNYEIQSDELETLVALMTPKSDTSDISAYVLGQGDKEIADKQLTIKTVATANAEKIVSNYKNNFNDTLEKDLKQKGGLQGCLDFIDEQISYFNIIKEEMSTESAEHDLVYQNKTNGEEGNASIISLRIQSIKNAEEGWNPLTKQNNIEEAIESYCRELITQLLENGESIRKKVCGDKVCKAILEELEDKKVTLGKFKDVLDVSKKENTKLLGQLRNQGTRVKHKFPINSFLYEQEEQNLNEQVQNQCYEALAFEDLLDTSSSVEVLRKLEEQIDQQELKQITDVKNIREVIREWEENDTAVSKTALKELVEFLSATSSVCVKTSTDWCTGYQNPLKLNVLTMPFPSNWNDGEKRDIEWFKGRSSLSLEKDMIHECNDDFKITLMQFLGPFPAMAVRGFPHQKDKYQHFIEVRGTFHHLDKQHQDMMDLFKDDSAEDALLYFGLGSILPQPAIYSEKRKYYFDDGTGKEKPMSEARSENNNCRAHAFNYFKKAKDWVEHIKNRVEEFQQRDPEGYKKLLLDHFDLISMNKGSKLKHNLSDPIIERNGKTMTSKVFLGNKSNISDTRESDHIIDERRRIIQHAIDDYSLTAMDYSHREVDGNITERWSKSDLQELGAMVLFRN